MRLWNCHVFTNDLHKMVGQKAMPLFHIIQSNTWAAKSSGSLGASYPHVSQKQLDTCGFAIIVQSCPFIVERKGASNLPTLFAFHYVEMCQKHISFTCNSKVCCYMLHVPITICWHTFERQLLWSKRVAYFILSQFLQILSEGKHLG